MINKLIEKLENLTEKKVKLKENTFSKMTDDQFWNIIDAAEKDGNKLEKILLKQEPQRIIEFNNIFNDYISQLASACEDYWESSSSDGFDYAMRGLIASGKTTVMNTLKNPGSQDLEEMENEEFGWAASDAFEKLTGQDIYEYNPNIQN